MRTISPLQPVVRETLVEQVSTRLIELIAASHWKQGERLPAEPLLAKELGIGRSTLREAINSLTFLGILQVRRGEGTFVGNGSTRLLDRCPVSGLLRTDFDLDHIGDARILLECELVARCAQKATEADLAKLAELEKRMEDTRELSTAAFTELDLTFHIRIAEAAGNPVLEQLFRTTRGLLQEWILRSQKNTQARGVAQRGHSEILAALRKRDAAKARKAMEKHLRESFALMRAAD
jgi:DNA-binding FadR family transcriptional regulator